MLVGKGDMNEVMKTPVTFLEKINQFALLYCNVYPQRASHITYIMEGHFPVCKLVPRDCGSAMIID